jgi:hypothetical protein
MKRGVFEMSEKLKPCPFCGGEPKFWDGLGTQADLTCDGCIVASVNMQVSDCLTQDEKYGNNGNAQPGFAWIGKPHYRYEPKAIQRVNEKMTEIWNTRFPQSPSSTPITNEGKERKGIEMKDIHKLKRQLDLFYQLERIENFCKTLEEGRVWVKAEEGEDIGYSNLIAYIEAIHFRTGFMGYGTFKLVDFQFPDSELLELNETILDGLLAAADKRIIKIKQKISELSDEGEKS